jgi:hypothetical protein
MIYDRDSIWFKLFLKNMKNTKTSNSLDEEIKIRLQPQDVKHYMKIENSINVLVDIMHESNDELFLEIERLVEVSEEIISFLIPTKKLFFITNPFLVLGLKDPDEMRWGIEVDYMIPIMEHFQEEIEFSIPDYQNYYKGLQERVWSFIKI